jgi:hypothetical protein
MKCEPAAAVLCAFVALGVDEASATGIYKCVDGGATAYQSLPCAPGASEIRLSPPASAVPALLSPAPRADAASPYPRRPGPWKHRTLTLGMSDDEVLNLPGWGRPSRITRVRLPREWREEWIYDGGLLAEQRLYFANAKLVDVVVMPSEVRVVGAAALP